VVHSQDIGGGKEHEKEGGEADMRAMVRQRKKCSVFLWGLALYVSREQKEAHFGVGFGSAKEDGSIDWFS